MGTTLTGTTPQDTYDSLIKVTDNGPLSGSLKKLTDGLGNDSSLSLSTTAASLSGTLAVTGASTFSSAITMALGGSPRLTLQDTDAGAGNVGILFQESTSPKWTLASVGGNFAFFNEATSSNAIYVSSTNNVGIGTSTPASRLHVSSTGDVEVKVNSSSGAYTSKLTLNAAGGGASVIDANGGTQPRLMFQNNGTTIASITNGGLCFNSDTAAANALDDYEEGTFTATLTDGTVTKTSTALYTKIGRVVSVRVGFTNAEDPSTFTGSVYITGLPFTPNGDYAASHFLNYTSTANAYSCIIGTDAVIRFYRVASASADFSQIQGSDLDFYTDIFVSGQFFV